MMYRSWWMFICFDECVYDSLFNSGPSQHSSQNCCKERPGNFNRTSDFHYGAGLVGALALHIQWFILVLCCRRWSVMPSSSFSQPLYSGPSQMGNCCWWKTSLRWIILIAYLMGLSIGVHLLNLLSIPAICIRLLFPQISNYTNGIIITSVIGVAILGMVQYGSSGDSFPLSADFDLFFVNTIRTSI